jgi:methylthioribulose-1-phosphate dehydratase
MNDPGPLAEAGERLAAEAARFASFGWMRGTSGNVSAVVSREPLRLAVTASGLDKGSLTAADIVVVGAAGQPVSAEAGPWPARPSAEAALHARVVRLTGAGAVVHVHTVAAVVAGRHWPSGVELTGLEMLKGIGVAASGETVTVPVIGNSQDMAELGDRLERSRDPRVPAAVVADHGLYAWGGDLLQARHHTEIIQWLLEFAITMDRS